MKSAKCKAAVLAVATTAALAAAPAIAREDSFAALQALDAQPLSAAEMDAVHGQAYTLAVAALLAYAAKVQAPTTTTSTPTTPTPAPAPAPAPTPQQTQAAAQYTAIAAALSSVKVVTQKFYVRTGSGLVLVRR